MKIVKLRVGEGRKKERGEGEGRKNTPARYHYSFGKLRTLERNKSFGIGEAGNVAFITQLERQSDFYTGIRTRFSCSAKTLHHFLAACFTPRGHD